MASNPSYLTSPLRGTRWVSGWNLPDRHFRDGDTVWWKFHNLNFNHFWLIKPRDRRTGDSICAICCRALKTSAHVINLW